MQRCFILVALFLSTITALHAQTGKLAALQAGRYTRQGTDVLVESGILKAPTGGFIATSAVVYPESTFSVHGMTAASITAISGKTVAFKATIDTYNQTNPGFLDNYTFSSESYPTVGGQSYIVTVGGTSTKAPTASVKVAKSTLTEGPKSSTTFDISLDKAAPSDIAIVFQFSGSAKSVSDYVSSHNIGSIKIKKGKKSASVKITLRDDKVKESNEKLTLTLKSSAGYKLGGKKAASLTIKDNDK